jgi:Ca2+:H+ antiporter
MNSSKKKGIPIIQISREIIIPLIALTFFLLLHTINGWLITLGALIALILAVLSAVHHAEIIAERVGEPFGALVLALAITVIEASIIISLMLSGDESVSALARDTVFAAVMIILTAMTGLTLLIGGIKYREQNFSTHGIISTLTVLVAISVLTLILPNFTQSVAGPFYSDTQLIFVAVTTLLLYGSFLFVQNFKHRNDFIATNETSEEKERPGKKATVFSSILLPVNLLAVVLLAEAMAPGLEEFIHSIGAPVSLSGIIIACVILLPEGISAAKAASKNHIQKSLNLSLGSALASISLTIPVVAIYAIYTGLPLALGINNQSTIIFLLSLFVVILSLSKGRTNILQGIVLLLLFVVYLFITIFP